MSKRRSFLVFLIISQCLMDFTILLALNFSIELFNYFNTKLVFTLKCTITQINTPEKSTLSQIHAPHVCFNVRQRFSDDHFFHNVFGQSTHQQLHITYLVKNRQNTETATLLVQFRSNTCLDFVFRMLRQINFLSAKRVSLLAGSKQKSTYVYCCTFLM